MFSIAIFNAEVILNSYFRNSAYSKLQRLLGYFQNGTYYRATTLRYFNCFSVQKKF